MPNPEQFSPEMGDKKEFSLTDIIDQDVVIPREYQWLIEKQESRSGRFAPTEFSNIWNYVAYNKERPPIGALSSEKARVGIEFFKAHLSGDVLVDLGGGKGFMKNPSRVWGVGTYVNVDRLYDQFADEDKKKVSDPSKVVQDYTERSGMRVNGVNADMLEFVTKMRSNSGNFTINGIDHYIVDDPDYNRALAQEIIRATKAGGLIFGAESDIFGFLNQAASAERAPIRRVDVRKEFGYPDHEPALNIFEKIEEPQK